MYEIPYIHIPLGKMIGLTFDVNCVLFVSIKPGFSQALKMLGLWISEQE